MTKRYKMYSMGPDQNWGQEEHIGYQFSTESKYTIDNR